MADVPWAKCAGRCGGTQKSTARTCALACCWRNRIPAVPASGVGLLSGLRVVEIAALGPMPWCRMALAGLGAEVIRSERPPHASAAGARRHGVAHRGRAATAAPDLKSAQGCARGPSEQVLEALDACVTPVLSMREAPRHPHLMGVFAVVGGVTQPMPAPRAIGDVERRAQTGACLHLYMFEISIECTVSSRWFLTMRSQVTIPFVPLLVSFLAFGVITA